MSKKIDARLHDLLKLAGGSTKHMCPHHYQIDLQNLKNTEVWKALSHHCVRDTEKHRINGLDCHIYPISAELFCLHYADKLASTISRRLTDTNYRSRTTFHAWRHKKEPFLQEIKTDQDFLRTINVTKDFSNIFFKYATEFKSRPEDIGGCPFASLYTHSILTERWFDFLTSNAPYFGVTEPIDKVLYTTNIIDIIEKSKEIYLCYVQIKTDTLLVRLKDTHILTLAEKVLSECIKAAGGTILYELVNGAIFAVPAYKSSDQLCQLMGTKLTSNFYFELTIRKTRLPYNENTDIKNNFLNCVSDLFAESEIRVYHPLLPNIYPEYENKPSRKGILCDLCQMAPAKLEHGKETTEYLCVECYNIRSNAPGSKKMYGWEQAGNTKIAILEIDLDMEGLLKALLTCFNREFKQELTKNHCGGMGVHSFGFSVIFEFLEVYKEFMAEVKNTICTTNVWRSKKKKIELDGLLDNVFIVKVEDLKDIISIVDEYTKVFTAFFPRFIEFKESPVYLTISCANIKYPFFEHWRFMNEYKTRQNQTAKDKRSSVFVNIVGKGQIAAEIWQMNNIVTFIKSFSKKGSLRALHKLAEIAEFSETLANKIMHDRSKGRGDYAASQVYHQLSDPKRPYGLDHRSLLTLAKILGDQRYENN